ncbi:MFS transporter [Streptomyces achromogenes]|uniref:MFS transporter n=1 Tax=Streptomyces achromogenes TaxID=67255 RepID=UPI00367C17F0
MIQLLLLFAAGAPSPLYPLYQAEWGFGPTAVTLVFALYAFGLLAALIVTGSLSDHIAPRPVLIASLLVGSRRWWSSPRPPNSAGCSSPAAYKAGPPVPRWAP